MSVPRREKGCSPKIGGKMNKIKSNKIIKFILLILILCILSYAMNHQWEMHIAAELRSPVRWAAQVARDQIFDYLLNELLQWLSEKANEYRADKSKSKLKKQIIKKPSHFKAKKNIK